MASELPAPFVPPEVDLTDYPDMLFAIDKFLDSSLLRIKDVAVFRCNVVSWPKSWHQNPAASLPDDDDELTSLLGYGFDVKGFRKIRQAGGLRGWIKCSDGRLYHKVTAGKALEAWISKLGQRLASGAGVAEKKGLAFDRVEIEQQIDRALQALRAVDPKSKTLQRRRLSGHPAEKQQGKPKTPPEEILAEKPPDVPPVRPSVIPYHDQVKGIEVKGIDIPKPTSSDSETAREVQGGGLDVEISNDFLALRDKFWPDDPRFPASFLTLQSQARGWIDQGGTRETIRETLSRGMASMARNGQPPANSFQAFRHSLQDAIAKAVAKTQPSEQLPDPTKFTDAEWTSRMELIYRRKLNTWAIHWGPEPGQRGSLVPAQIQRAFGFDPAPVEAA